MHYSRSTAIEFVLLLFGIIFSHVLTQAGNYSVGDYYISYWAVDGSKNAASCGFSLSVTLASAAVTPSAAASSSTGAVAAGGGAGGALLVLVVVLVLFILARRKAEKVVFPFASCVLRYLCFLFNLVTCLVFQSLHCDCWTRPCVCS